MTETQQGILWYGQDEKLATSQALLGTFMYILFSCHNHPDMQV